MKFTHLAKLYGFKCYWNNDTKEVKGTNWFNDLMIDFFLCFDIWGYEFEIVIIKEL